MSSRIVLLPGDGVGPEVVAAARTVLTTVATRDGLSLDFDTHPIGGAALDLGLPSLPDATRDACVAADAVLLGAVGTPKWDHLPRETRCETGLLRLRRAMGVFANLRPARHWPGTEDSLPFRPERIDGVDMIVVRELLGGLYFGEPRGVAADGQSGVNTMRYTVPEIERVARVAFELAQGRQKKLTSIDKANVLEASQVWRATVTRLAADYPDVTLSHLYVDAASMLLIQYPKDFDVVVAENLFGDILSDEVGAIAGSLGLLPSASLGAGPGLYEPVHGSAPTLAGKDVANPAGTILSAALLLRHSLKREAAAARIERAVEQAIREGVRTVDVAGAGSSVGCRAFTEAVLARL